MIQNNMTCKLDDVILYQGDTKDFEVIVTDEQGMDVVLDTVKVRFILCEILDESIVQLTKLGVNKKGTNQSDIKLSTLDTQEIPMNKYTYKIEIEYNTGDKNIGKGYFTIM